MVRSRRSRPSQGQGGINIDGQALAIRISVIEENCQKNEKGGLKCWFVIVGTVIAGLEPDAMKDSPEFCFS